ncbi:hypothetical protein [Lysobacter sp. Root690]|uniref:hypothetical protein n=1 Tax=Lysobacter sp. Root690 TaxID=1736588 RepID=UPI0006F3C497|nr:hypothetical protein [Lysobacter sp. Root690]KRB10279.1 hypothetical protein ASD86_25110 [Lysobacter sp. Root690]
MGTGRKGVGLAAATLAAAGLLGGCSGRPSTEDAQAAFVAEFDRAFDGGARVEDVRRFELSNCEPAREVDGYLCDVEGELVLNIAGTQVPRPLKGRFRFSDSTGAWKAYQP